MITKEAKRRAAERIEAQLIRARDRLRSENEKRRLAQLAEREAKCLPAQSEMR